MSWRLAPLRALALLFFGLLLLSLSSPRLLAAAELIHGQGRLFEVSREGAPPSYVFGTIHINDRKVLKLPATIANALRQSTTLMLEFDGKADPAATLDAWLYSDGHRLADALDPALYKRVMSLSNSLDLRQDMVERTRPGALWYLLQIAAANGWGHGSSRPVLDRALMDFANKKGIPVVGLDRNSESDGLLVARFSEAEQVALLAGTVEAISKGDLSAHDLSEMRDLYLAGDLTALYEYKDAELEDAGLKTRFDHELLTVRNHRWIPRMKDYLSRGKTFVAVGAAHLPGETGILHLLEQEGFTVKRVL